jgi:hypothetical protein
MHTMNFKVEGYIGYKAVPVDITVHHNSDWSGDAIIEFVDPEAKLPVEIRLSGKLLVQLGEAVAKDDLSRHVISAIEDWEGGRPREKTISEVPHPLTDEERRELARLLSARTLSPIQHHALDRLVNAHCYQQFLGLTHEQIEIACQNVGIDLHCPGCAELFYTGSTTLAHSCKER